MAWGLHARDDEECRDGDVHCVMMCQVVHEGQVEHGRVNDEMEQAGKEHADLMQHAGHDVMEHELMQQHAVHSAVGGGWVGQMECVQWTKHVHHVVH